MTIIMKRKKYKNGNDDDNNNSNNNNEKILKIILKIKVMIKIEFYSPKFCKTSFL